MSATPLRQVLRGTGPLSCERGGRLADVEIAFTTWGSLSPRRDNVVWILHPLTCSADPLEWWPEFVGPGRAIDPAVHFVVCANSLGSCYGTTGPASCDPQSGAAYGRGFPAVTLKDVVAVHERVRAALGIDRIRLGIGGSYGGQQLIEWMAASPRLFQHACVIGTGLRQTPWAIAFNESQRMALEADPSFLEGGTASAGLAAARSIAVLSYRSAEVYRRTQSESDENTCDGFRAAAYQRHLGARFVQRFDAHAYWTLTKAMDSHNPARGRASLREALATIATQVLFVALPDDVLFPRQELEAAAAAFPHGHLEVIDSDYGHDAILTHAAQIGAALQRFLEAHANSPDAGVSGHTEARHARVA